MPLALLPAMVLAAGPTAPPALDAALVAKDTAKVKALLDAGLDPNLVDAYGRPALVAAVNHRCPVALLDLLLARGADANFRERTGMTL